MNAEGLVAECEKLGLSLASEQISLFDEFESALYRANEVMNLTRVPREECWIRHFLDSLLFQDLIPEGATVLDIGCGPGFPSWPIACARPDLKVTALDSSGKMLGFLKSQPLPNLHIICARAEEWSTEEPFDIITGRALAPLGIQLEVSAPHCKVGGAVIPMRTPTENLHLQSLGALGLAEESAFERELFDTGIYRVFPVFRKTTETKPGYPRRWADVRKKPLT